MDAFVLGGGGQLGASEVGMLRALLERGITADLVVGTSVGAINGAASPASRRWRWSRACRRPGRTSSALTSSPARSSNRLATLARTGTHLHGNDALRATLTEALPIALIEDLPVRFQCVAASIESAAEHWFIDRPGGRRGARQRRRPGILPPVEVRGEHYIDGGIVNSIPVDRAVQLGADRIFVMHVGRLDRPLEPPRWPWEVALVAFEIARRHRFLGDLASLPEGVEIHVMPTGQPEPPKYNDLSALRYRVQAGVGESIDRAHEASLNYLTERWL